jgi:23S rRNA (guanosine2251-2'-O)-methyltransferase
MKERFHSTPEIWITGMNPVREAMKAGGVPVRELILARSDPRGRELAELAQRKAIPVRRESKDVLSALVGHEHHQGAALRADEFVYTNLEALLAQPAEEREPLVILDTIQDPQNLGAILRSACFLGAKGVVMPVDRSARVTATVIKIAAGATSYIPVVQVVNLARTLDTLKERGIWTVGLDAAGNQSIYDVDLTVPVALAIGNEQKGLRPLVRKNCDILAGIPAHGPIDSLNAATAGAVALAEVQRQRLASRR